MQPLFFISDLHLCAQRSEVNEYLDTFIEDIFIPNSNTLYIIGDFFEYWIGDDGAQLLGYNEQIDRLTRLTTMGKSIYFMHGNRDFLIGQAFSDATGVKILSDPHTLTLTGKKCMIKHGDDLCTDDVEHQKFRVMTRDENWQASVLSKSLDERIALASQMRQMSGSNYKSAEIMDVNESFIEQFFTTQDIDILIHGHTHRPAIHDYVIDDKAKQRIVLGDWHKGVSYLRVDDNGFDLVHQ